jgi:hypothetical protein
MWHMSSKIRDALRGGSSNVMLLLATCKRTDRPGHRAGRGSRTDGRIVRVRVIAWRAPTGGCLHTQQHRRHPYVSEASDYAVVLGCSCREDLETSKVNLATQRYMYCLHGSLTAQAHELRAYKMMCEDMSRSV